MNQVQLSPRPQAGSPMIKRCIVMTLFFIVLASSMHGHAADRSSSVTESPQRRDSRMQWWREARFGMFVHWGLYSGLAGTWEGKPVPETLSASFPDTHKSGWRSGRFLFTSNVSGSASRFFQRSR